MKVRFDGLDVTAMVALLQHRLLGRKVINLYDGDSGDSFVIKFDGDGSSTGTTTANSNSNITESNNSINVNESSNNNSNNSKNFLLIESGVRFHSLSHFISSQPAPSPFCAKLRKHIRGLRLEQLTQLGLHDRVVLFQFGIPGTTNKYALILELYAKGNIILCNAAENYNILSLLRNHVYTNNINTSKSNDNNNNNEDKEKDSKVENTNQKEIINERVAVKVGQVYPVTYATSIAAVSTGNKSGSDDLQSQPGIWSMNGEQLRQYAIEQLELRTNNKNNSNNNSKATKKNKKQDQLSLKTLLLQPNLGVSHYGPALLEHCILYAKEQPFQTLTLENCTEEIDWQTLLTSLQQEGTRVLQNLQASTTNQHRSTNSNSFQTQPGYILYRLRTEKEKLESDNSSTLPLSDIKHSDKIFEEFQPHLLLQHQEGSAVYLTFDNFDDAVQEFFNHIGMQKKLTKAKASQTAVHDKLEKIKQDQLDRLHALQSEQELLKAHAKAVERNADNVDKALTVINSALDSGMGWDQLEQLVKMEQEQNNNPIALLIKRLDLDKDAMVLNLVWDPYDEQSERYDIVIDLKDTAHGNASALFAKYRSLKEKSQKTLEASENALKAAEESAKRQLAEAQKKNNQILTAVQRKTAWYEKFHWCITTDNYLVLGGKDAHQNELLVKRYLRPGDAYLHADVHGASSCILRAKRRRRRDGSTEIVPLSDQALREAGSFTICHSSAWSSRMVTSAWWVEAHQVSKTAPTGEYLTVGSFMVRGKKNFLPPSQLELGLAVLFRLGDDDSIARHKNDRRDFALLALEQADEGVDDNDDINDSIDDMMKSENTNRTDMSHEVENEHVNIRETSQSYVPEDDPAEFEVCGRKAANRKNLCMKDSTTTLCKKGLSARDRRLLKKFGSLENVPNTNKCLKDIDDDVDLPKADPTNDTIQLAKRGKKSKLKKAKQKYLEQDDEDKTFAMQALQGGEKLKKKERKVGKQSLNDLTREKIASETVAILGKDSFIIAENLLDEVKTILTECIKSNDSNKDTSNGSPRWDLIDANVLEQLTSLEPQDAQLSAVKRLSDLTKETHVNNLSSSLGGIVRTIKKFGHKNMLNKNESKSTVKEAETIDVHSNALNQAKDSFPGNEEENDDEDMNDAIDDTIELSKLTGKPVPEDLLLYAVPVCAPYQILSQYSFRVKLTPGNMKRGKAVKECLELLLKKENTKTINDGERCQALIKKVADTDWIQVMNADVKIATAGSSKILKKSKGQCCKKK